MSTATMSKTSTSTGGPRLILHPSFEEANARTLYLGDPDRAEATVARSGYMPDDLTRDFARRMHYAAFRKAHAKTKRDRSKWQQRYFAMRDKIILGNHKLIFRAISKRPMQNHADDLIGECYLVLIRAVAAYNPWIGVRFSTYAFTCLMRALSRLGKRLSVADALSRTLTPEMTGDLHEEQPEEAAFDPSEWNRVAGYFRKTNPLLTPREKAILKRRFALTEGEVPTLSQLGAELGISKERVRQIEITAIEKLRRAVLEIPSNS